MAHLMLKLERALQRRRWIVLGAWLAAVAVAVPLAARQSDHLTGGGYDVPGSQSAAVAAALERDFGASDASLGAVVRGRGELAALQRATRAVPGVALSRAAKARAAAGTRG